MKDLMMFLEYILAIRPDITIGEAGRLFRVWRVENV